MYQKFAMGLPLNRQEKNWFRLGLVLPRAEMAHWVIRCSQEWLAPISDRIHQQLLKCEVLHMDETRIQCNKERGRKASNRGRLLGKYWRVILDGTGLFYFKEKHCDNCLCTTHRTEDGKTIKRYYHKVLEAKIVLSDKVVISLETEFIEIGQSIKNTSSRLLESFRRQTVTDEDVSHIFRYTTVYLE